MYVQVLYAWIIRFVKFGPVHLKRAWVEEVVVELFLYQANHFDNLPPGMRPHDWVIFQPAPEISFHSSHIVHLAPPLLRLQLHIFPPDRCLCLVFLRSICHKIVKLQGSSETLGFKMVHWDFPSHIYCTQLLMQDKVFHDMCKKYTLAWQ